MTWDVNIKTATLDGLKASITKKYSEYKGRAFTLIFTYSDPQNKTPQNTTQLLTDKDLQDLPTTWSFLIK